MAHEVTPETVAQPAESTAAGGGVRQRAAWLWRYWRRHRSNLIFLALFTLVSTAAAVAYPLAFRWVIDRLNEVLGTGESGAGEEAIRQVLLVLSAILVARFVAGFYPAARARMNLKLEVGIREDVFGKLMEKDFRFGTRFRTGDVVTRLTDDIAEFPKVSWFGCSGVFRAVESSSKMIFCLAVMAMLNWKLALVSILPLPFMMWFFYSLRHRMRFFMRATQRIISRTNDMLEAAFSGIRIVKAFRAEAGQRRRLAELMEERVGLFVNLIKLQTLVHSLDTVASRVGQMIVLAVGGYLVVRGETTIGTLYAFYVYLDMLTQPMMDIPFLFMTGQQAFVSIDRVEEVRAFPVAERLVGGRDPGPLGELAFEHVSFAYDGQRNVIDDLTFTIPHGTRVAVVGPVASGKSTLLKLVAGILRPTQGRVLVNGISLRETDWDAYRRQIGYVPQESGLFSHSLAENVIFGRPLPDGWADREAWARQCLSVAQMDRDLEQLPAGLETMAGQKGGLVSGGQKQRVAIARALAGRPAVLLLDDCTAALDARNEDRFWAQLAEERTGGTTFFVSHRLATIRRADRILVLDGGRLIDQGTHAELAQRCQTYREFLQIEQTKAHLDAQGAQS